MDIRPVNINTISNVNGSGLSKAPGKISTQAEPVRGDFTRSREIYSVMNNTPEIRADKVAEARALINDPSFPSDEELGKISQLIVANYRG